jgi:hypothetical protein
MVAEAGLLGATLVAAAPAAVISVALPVEAQARRQLCPEAEHASTAEASAQ